MNTAAGRRRRLWLWLGFLAGAPEVPLYGLGAGAAALGSFGLLFTALWKLLSSVFHGPALAVARNILLLPVAVCLFAAFAVSVGALCAAAAARLQGARLTPGRLLAVLGRVARAAPALMGSRQDRGERPGAAFMFPALVCEGFAGAQAVLVAQDLQQAYAPLVREVHATADEVSGWLLLPLILLGLGAGPLVILVPSGADPYRWLLWHAGPFVLACVLLPLLVGAAIEIGAVAAYLYATGDQAARARVLPLLPDVDTRRIPEPSEFQREKREERETLAFAHELMTPLGKLKYLGPIALLPVLIVWQFAPGVFSLPARLLGTPVEAQVTSWRDSGRDCDVWFQFQARPGYAPTTHQYVRRGMCSRLKQYQKVRAHFLSFHPDTAVLDDDGGKLGVDLILLAILALWFAGSMALPFLL